MPRRQLFRSHRRRPRVAVAGGDAQDRRALDNFGVQSVLDGVDRLARSGVVAHRSRDGAAAQQHSVGGQQAPSIATITALRQARANTCEIRSAFTGLLRPIRS